MASYCAELRKKRQGFGDESITATGSGVIEPIFSSPCNPSDYEERVAEKKRHSSPVTHHCLLLSYR